MAGLTGRGLVIPVFFLGGVVTYPRLPLGQKYLPIIFACLAFILQNFHESWYRKSLAIEWNKNLFDESKKEDANEF